MREEIGTCETGLVINEPADSDAFGPHSRLARTIAALVRSETGGRTIGLEGRWGIGKSTVVRLLEHELASDPKTRLVPFDAWAHEGDPLRRSFLERVISDLSADSVGWIRKSDWEKRRKELTGRRRTTITIPRPSLTWKGRAFAVGALVAPLGTVLVGAALTADPVSARLLAVGLVAIFAPILFAVLVRNWDLLSVTSVATTESNTVETGDPTSVEFEATFKELMHEALGKQQGRRLILVIDNLDRLSPAQSLTIWSTLQTFLQSLDYRDQPWRTFLWVLFPYDRGSIERLWDGADNSDGKRAESFLDKSIQITFTVPSPVLSNWREHMLVLLRSVLPDQTNHPDVDLDTAYRVYVAIRSEPARSPTPRELEQFANGIGSLHRERQDDFTPAEYGLYYLLRRQGVDVASYLVDAEGPTEEQARLVGKNIAEFALRLAALWFGTGEDLAAQLLLRDRISVALREGDADELRRLSELPAGFWEVLDQLDFRNFDPSALAGSAGTLLKSELLTAESREYEILQLRQRFGEAAGAATEWDPVEVEGLAAVIRVASDAQVSRVLLQSIDGREFQNQADVEGAVASADAVLSAIRDIDREALPSYSLNLSVPPDSLVGFCRELDVRGVDSELLARIDLPAFDPDVLQQGLVATIQGGSGAELLPVIRVMEHIQATAAWQSVHDTLFDRLREGWSVEGPESVDLLLVAKALARVHAQARESLRSLVREGYALHYIHHSQSAGAAAVATWLVEYLKEFPQHDQTERVGDGEAGAGVVTAATDDPDRVSAMADLLTDSGEEEIVFQISAAHSDISTLGVALVVSLASQAPSKVLTPDRLIRYWSTFQRALREAETGGAQPIPPQDIASVPELQARLTSSDLEPDLASLYLVVVENTEEPTEEFIEWLQRGVDSLSSEQWLEALKQNDALIDLLIRLRKRDDQMQLGAPFAEGLERHAAEVAGGQPFARDSEDVNTLIDVVQTSSREYLADRLMRLLIEGDGEISEMFFETYGPPLVRLSGPGDLASASEMYGDLLNSLLDKENAPGLTWGLDVLEQASQEGGALPEPETRGHFEDKLKRALVSPDDTPLRSLLERLAGVLGVDAPEPDADEGDVDQSPSSDDG